MTKKQFSIADNFKIVAIRDNGKIMNSRQVCDTLNQLSDKNKQLKKCNSKAKNHIEDIIFLLNNTPSQTLSRDDLITLVQKTKEYLE